MGAYVGELIVRSGCGRWLHVPEADAPGVQLISGLVCFPLNSVAERITVGPEHSIAQFVEVAMSGTLPSGAQPVDPPSRGGRTGGGDVVTGTGASGRPPPPRRAGPRR